MEHKAFYVGGKKVNVTVKAQVNTEFCKKTTKRSHD